MVIGGDVNISGDSRLRFTNGANIVQMDSAMRILIPKKLQEYASLESNIVLSAYNNKVELWSKENYEKELTVEADELSNLAQHFFTQQSNQGKKED